MQAVRQQEQRRQGSGRGMNNESAGDESVCSRCDMQIVRHACYCGSNKNILQMLIWQGINYLGAWEGVSGLRLCGGRGKPMDEGWRRI